MKSAAAERDGDRSRRALVLRALRAAAEPLGVADVARQLGVHTNTARFHLDGLVADGAVVRSLAEPDGPGRPRAVYYPRPGMDRSGAREYQFLSRILLSRLAAEGPGAAGDAEDAGRMWGRHVAAPAPPFRRPPSADEAVGTLAKLLADLGFAPERGGDANADSGAGVGADANADSGADAGADSAIDGHHSTLRLRHCPFLELAEEFGRVVCPMHLGLMRGALEQMGAPVTAVGLEPFAEPGACIVRLVEAQAVPTPDVGASGYRHGRKSPGLG